MKQQGAGWIVFEEAFDKRTRALVSILPPRRTASQIAQFMQQVYVDRYFSLRERIAFKKSPKSAPYKVTAGPHCNPLHIGHEPFLVGIYAHRIAIECNNLDFVYRILVRIDEKSGPIFEERSQSIEVDA